MQKRASRVLESLKESTRAPGVWPTPSPPPGTGSPLDGYVGVGVGPECPVVFREMGFSGRGGDPRSRRTRTGTRCRKDVRCGGGSLVLSH